MIKLEIPSDNQKIINAAAAFFVELADQPEREVPVLDLTTATGPTPPTAEPPTAEPPAPALTAEPPTTEPPAPTTELDRDGIPWDSRIHAGTKTRNVDETWRVKRCPKDQTAEQWQAHVDAIKAELLAVQSVPGPGPEAPAPTGTVTTFAELTNRIVDQDISSEQINAACQQIGVPSFPVLGGRPDLVLAFAEALGL